MASQVRVLPQLLCSSLLLNTALEASPAGKQVSRQSLAYNGVFALLLLNFALFVADKALHLPGVAALYLHHSNPRWWQFLTAAFCHASWQHISGNAFMLLVFGRIVEEEARHEAISKCDIEKSQAAEACSQTTLGTAGGVLRCLGNIHLLCTW